MKIIKAFMLALVVIVFLAGCSAPVKQYAQAQEQTNEELYKNEGAHFELPYEFWMVSGELKTEKGPAYYGGYFHKVGSQFFHSRNGYNYLRLPDGKYDFRSFGQPMVRQLAGGALSEMIRAFPDDARYPAIKAKLDANESERFYQMSEEEMPMHRGRLFINFAGNRMERMNNKKYEYEVDIQSWAGPLNLKLSTPYDPIIMDQDNSIAIKNGEMQGIAFFDLETSGKMNVQGAEENVTGSSMMVHLFGQPGAVGGGRNDMFFIRMSNNDVMFVSAYHDRKDELMNMNAYYLVPGEEVKNKIPMLSIVTDAWSSELTKVDYPVEWDVSSDEAQGTVKMLYKDSEVMLEQGVGSFLMGPCEFVGKKGEGFTAPKVTGKGICRVTGYNAAKRVLGEEQPELDNEETEVTE